jgi:hypothetical protein
MAGRFGVVAPEAERTYIDVEPEGIDMTILDLTKATLVCGAAAFFIYSFPLLGQIVVIGLLGLLWLFYVLKTVRSMRHRNGGVKTP